MPALTIVEIKKQLRSLNPKIEIIGDYTGYLDHLKCKCNQCQHVWTPTWHHLKHMKTGCPRCALNKTKHTTEWIRRKLKKTSPQIEIIGEYTSNSAPLRCLCGICKTKWNSTWQRLRIGSGCPRCAVSSITLPHVKVARALAKRKIKLTNKYEGARKQLKCQCQVCNHKWVTTWASLSSGHGCPECARIRLSHLSLSSTSYVLKRIKEANSKVEMVGTYKGRAVKVECKCLKCHRIWKVRPYDLFKGSGCPWCQTSKGEELVREVIEEFTGKKFPRASPSVVPFLRGLTLDGYCPSLVSKEWPGGVAYERQGQQHYKLVNFGGNLDSTNELERRRRRDRRKRIQCWRHRVKLIRIPYWVRSETQVKSYLYKRLKSCNLIEIGAN